MIRVELTAAEGAVLDGVRGSLSVGAWLKGVLAGKRLARPEWRPGSRDIPRRSARNNADREEYDIEERRVSRAAKPGRRDHFHGPEWVVGCRLKCRLNESTPWVMRQGAKEGR